MYAHSSVPACIMALDNAKGTVHTSGFCCASANAKSKQHASGRPNSKCDYNLMLYISLSVLSLLNGVENGQAGPSICIDELSDTACFWVCCGTAGYSCVHNSIHTIQFHGCIQQLRTYECMHCTLHTVEVDLLKALHHCSLLSTNMQH